MKFEYTETYMNKTVDCKSEFIVDNEIESEIINIYPHIEYQKFSGFGCAVTDSSGYVFSQMSEDLKEQVVCKYFSKNDMKYNTVRIPIDSCDFSLEHYEADHDESDEFFENFSFKRVEKYIIPLLNAAQNAYGEKLDIMLAPWSPPAYMKTNRERNNGGKLEPKYRKRWAEYICRYIIELKNRGYNVTKLSLQNEPKAKQTWDSCVYTAEEQKAFLKDFMYHSLIEHGLGDIEIYLWDHNKERALEWSENIIEETTYDMIGGVAFHWYSGDHFEVLQMLKKRFPDKQLILSEACIEYSQYSAADNLKNAQRYAHDIIGNLNSGMNAFYDWNMLLDEKGGPNHVGNFCEAPFQYDINKKELMYNNILKYLWHLSHFVESDSVRIGISRYTDKLEITAFKKGNKISVIILNRTDEDIKANIRIGNQYSGIVVKKQSILSGIIE